MDDVQHTLHMGTDTLLAINTGVSDSFMRPLMYELSETATRMFEYAIVMPKESYVRKTLLINVLESRHVQRQIWLAANRTQACACKIENAAATANSMAVCMLYLNKDSLARLWYNIALLEAVPTGHVHFCVQANLMALDNAEKNLSRASTPTHEEESASQEFANDEELTTPLWATELLSRAHAAITTLRNVLDDVQ